MLTLAIDTASDTAGLALADGDILLAEMTWASRQSHSRQLLPTLEVLLERIGRAKTDIEAVAVCLGPGSYAGLRVGVSTAKALAFGFEIPVIGIGRLAADAFPLAGAVPGRIIPLQAAGRAELAWAAYEPAGAGMTELLAPRLSRKEELPETLREGDVVCAELRTLTDELKSDLLAAGVKLVEAPVSRVLAVMQLGSERLARGEVDNLDTLVPLYLRAPAIGPQPPRAG